VVLNRVRCFDAGRCRVRSADVEERPGRGIPTLSPGSRHTIHLVVDEIAIFLSRIDESRNVVNSQAGPFTAVLHGSETLRETTD